MPLRKLAPRKKRHRKRITERDSDPQNLTIFQKNERLNVLQLDLHDFLKRYVPARFTKNVLQNILEQLNLPRAHDGSTHEVAGRFLHCLKMLQTTRNSSPPPKFLNLTDSLLVLEKAKKILVVTGAGISTSLGIPDFRSFQGIYSQLSRSGLENAQQVFHIDRFCKDPTLFYLVAHKILPQGDKVSDFHRFLRLLEQKNKLLRVYTQNIDNLELAAGIDPSRIVHCHGTLSTSTCLTCRATFSGAATFAAIKMRQVPYCSLCVTDLGSVPMKGLIKPDITFFGEDVSSRFETMIGKDVEECDLLLVAGTSLKVEPVASIVRNAQNVKKVLVNRDKIDGFDINFLGNCDDISGYICQELKWKLETLTDANFYGVEVHNDSFQVSKR